MEIVDTLAQEFGLKKEYSQNIITLLDEGCTIPFIARYRKEMHGTCDDQTLRAFADRLKYLRNLNDEKAKVEKAITEQGKWTEELKIALENAQTLTEVEDIYRPYKPKRKTRASVAIAKGLEGLADILQMQSKSYVFEKEAEKYITEEVKSIEEAIAGAKDIVADYETRCANNPNVVQKAMITCSSREIAYDLYQIIAEIRPDWVKPVRALDESVLTAEQLKKLNPVRFMNVIATRGKDDEKDMYDLLGDKEYRKKMADEYKNDKSNFCIAIVVDMWITGFDAPPLTMMYNDKPLQKHTLIQTISRVNRVYPGKECGYIIDYIGIRENMKEAMKRYGGDITDGTDLDKAHEVLQTEVQVLKDMTYGLDFTDFFGDKPLARLQFLQSAAEFIMDNSVQEKGKVSLLTRYKGHVKRLKTAYDICNPAGILTDEETGWAQCFMGIMSFLRKITDTSHDVDSMNRHVEQMVKEALSCTGIESVLNATETEENIFDATFLKELDDVKMPNTKFQLLVKMLTKAIKEYSHTNKVRGEEFMEMLNKVVDKYNTRDKLTFTNEVATDAVNSINGIVDSKIEELTDQLLQLFQELKTDKEEFVKLGITFEEKAFYDILTSLRDKHKFEYPDDKCKFLAAEIKKLIDGSSLYADFLNNPMIKAQLSADVVRLLYKNGYPPEWNEEVFEKVIEQVENFKQYRG